MKTAKQPVSKSKENHSFCRHIEALESRRLLSASAFDSDAPLHGHHDHHDHHHQHHLHIDGKAGEGALTTFSNVVISIRPILIQSPLPTFRAEPEANSDVTQWQDFSTNPLFASGGPSPDDVAQGQVGDCWFLAALAETALRDPARIKEIVHQRCDGTYDVFFHTSDTTAIDEHIDGQLPENSSGRLEYAKLGQDGCTWVAIMEKAFTYFRRRSLSAAYQNINGGWGTEAMADLGVQAPDVLPDVSNSSQLFTDVMWGQALGDGMLLGTNAWSGPLVSSHEYSIIAARVQSGLEQIEVRNPWGHNPHYTNDSNYDATNDGYMWVNVNSIFGQLSEFWMAKV